MKKLLSAAALAAALSGGVFTVSAQTVTVGGQAMYPTKDIVDNAVNSADHTHACRGGQGCRPRPDAQGNGPVKWFICYE